MARTKLTQADVAGILKWTQPRVSKVLRGRVELGVDDLGALCFAVGLSPTEVLRDRGLEFCAEMTPTELRVLERLRQLSPPLREAFLVVLQAHIGPNDARSATARRPVLGKPRPR
jgi:transcriptional regulator with XRE-family HTH domain